MSTFEEYRARCLAAGETEESIKNSWELMEAIDHILQDKDCDPYRAPETQLPQKARLARLFINRVQEATRENDATIAKWVQSKDGQRAIQAAAWGVDSADVSRLANVIGSALASAFRSGEHWAWWRKQKGVR